MTERVLRIKLEETFGPPHVLAKQQIDIIKNKDGSYYSKHTRMNEKLEKISSKKKLASSDIDNIISLISKITIPAFPQHQMGCDGGFTEIEIGDYCGKSSFRWWSVPPKGWEELDAITTKIIEYVGISEAE